MTWQISPFGNDQFFDSNGNLAVGYKLFTYLAGTSTKEAVATDFSGAGFHTNPIILNSLGLPPSPIYLNVDKAYKFVFTTDTDSDPPAAPLYTADNVTVKDLETVFSEWVTGTTPTYLSGTQFSVVGDQRITYHIGRRVKCVASGSTVYGTISSSAFGTVTTVTVTIDDGLTISASLSTVYYGLLSASGSSWPSGHNTNLVTRQDGNLEIKASEPGIRLIGTEASAKDYLIKEIGGTLKSFINTGTEATPTWTEDNFLASSGDIKFGAYSSGNIPGGWLLCDGAAVSRSTYARLFAVIGATYGAGDGSTTFNLPDLRGRVPISIDGSANRITSASVNGANADTLGGVGGAETHTLQTSEIPAHTHTYNSVTGGISTFQGGVAGALLGASTGSTGGGGAHSNTQPWIALNACIKT